MKYKNISRFLRYKEFWFQVYLLHIKMNSVQKKGAVSGSLFYIFDLSNLYCDLVLVRIRT